jgi:uncharacterized protein
MAAQLLAKTRRCCLHLWLGGLRRSFAKYARRSDHPTLVLLHGLEGSSNAPYVKGIADKAIRRGFNVVRLNQRNCGHTDHLSTSLYHSGLSEDPAAVIDEIIRVDGLRSIGVIGYSLGGNLALRLAGVYGDAAPPQLHSVGAVSPPIDLARAAGEIERLANCFYQRGSRRPPPPP